MQVYNTLTNRKEEFVPIEPGKVRMYVCGPTVYNFFHIGNARPFVVFDTLRRYFKYRGYEVKFVQNFTDVDDKIINRAKEEGITAPEVSEKYIKEYFNDAEALNVMKADVHPKVSEHIPEIIEFVQTLIDKGYAYEADGDVYYSTRKFEEYGKLSGQNIDDLAREIDDLHETKLRLQLEDADRTGVRQRMKELEVFMDEQTDPVTDYDEGLARKLIEKITVYDDHLVFEFRSGIETEIQI